MDQNEYYTIYQEFINFQKYISENELKLSSKNDKSDIKKLQNHINNLHLIIFNEIQKNSINTPFLEKLRKEINNFQINN